MTFKNQNKIRIVICILFGVFFAIAVFHPITHIVMSVFDVRGNEGTHFHISKVLDIFIESFNLKYWSHFLVYGLLMGTIGYFYGSVVAKYREIQENLKRFSYIGMKASQIVHDLNNQLTVLGANTEFLNPMNGTEFENKAQKRILTSIDKIKKMNSQILQVSRGEKIILNTEQIKIIEFLKVIINNSKYSKFMQVITIEECIVNIDRYLVDRLFENIFKNAIEACKDKINPEILIDSKKTEDMIEVSIRDNGCGIAKKNLKQLFKQGKTFGKKHGTGFGPYNCKEIIELHGGSIRIQSKVNLGTIVIITLPCNISL